MRPSVTLKIASLFSLFVVIKITEYEPENRTTMCEFASSRAIYLELMVVAES